jgi:hypothetical protein
MRTKEYTWVRVNDIQVLFRKVKQGFKIMRKDFRSAILEKQ